VTKTTFRRQHNRERNMLYDNEKLPSSNFIPTFNSENVWANIESRTQLSKKWIWAAAAIWALSLSMSIWYMNLGQGSTNNAQTQETNYSQNEGLYNEASEIYF
jgi:hypothetical protein